MGKRKAETLTLFNSKVDPRPLAERMRPERLDEVLGQEHLLGPGKLLNQMVTSGKLSSLILWGPPGSGKTTVAKLLAKESKAIFRTFSAVSAGTADLREVVEDATQELALTGRRTVLFLDEIHRWNKAQQDSILPHVESGLLTLIGATTENPSFAITAPLLSRTQVLVLFPLSPACLRELLYRALQDRIRGLGKLELQIADAVAEELVRFSSGDARRLLNALEAAAHMAVHNGRKSIELVDVQQATQVKTLLYDRRGEEHYNLVSAFIKSMRGSDPDAALYWLMRMVEAGEDPLFIARRMVIFAAEDIGNADPQALTVALSVKEALEFVGMPEGSIPLAQGVTYLATAPKSNASYRAMWEAKEDVHRHGALAVPMHLRNAPTELMKTLGYGKDYEYPHDSPEGVTSQTYFPDELKDRQYYRPTDRGYEKRIRELMAAVRRLRNQ